MSSLELCRSIFKRLDMTSSFHAILRLDTLRSRFPLPESPIYATAAELEALELDFAKLSKYQLRGTIAAGDGIVFRMQMPTNEQVEGDVTAYYTRKGYYAYGLQVCTLICPLLIVILFLINFFFPIRLLVMQIVNLLCLLQSYARPLMTTLVTL